ncbi:MAG: carboxypeptidase-like regulatory domain-containing protein [Candidatus Aenigmatarchaeota archaeon]|nr:carboxypeptidase-like regulatory domain-containing protein [Candidatus Aenigmarchaeota archaeon]
MKKYIIILISIIILSSISFAETLETDSYTFNLLVPIDFNSLNSDSYTFKFALSQPTIGISSSEQNSLCIGIFCTSQILPLYAIKISGTLNYSDNTSVSNAKIIVTTPTSKKSTITDKNGNFEITIYPVLEYYIKKPFEIEIYVIGKIEAIYTCTYDWYSNTCN